MTLGEEERLEGDGREDIVKLLRWVWLFWVFVIK